MKTFVESQFNYCPLLWMFHSRRLNNEVNNVHEKALRIVYSDYKSTFQELLDKQASFSVHHRNIQFSGRFPETGKYGTETIYFLAPKVSALFPGKIKECSCLEAFKSKTRKWKPDCPCRLCKNYLEHVGFLEICINHKCIF